MVCDILDTIRFLYKKKSDHMISPNGFCDVAKSGLWFKNWNDFIIWYHSTLFHECEFISRHIVFPISASFERRDLFLLFIHVNAGSIGMNVLSLSISCSCGCILLVPITLTWHSCKSNAAHVNNCYGLYLQTATHKRWSASVKLKNIWAGPVSLVGPCLRTVVVSILQSGNMLSWRFVMK